MGPKSRSRKSSTVDKQSELSRGPRPKTDIMIVEPSNFFRAGLDHILSGSPYRIISHIDIGNLNPVLPIVGRPPDLIILGTSIEGIDLVEAVQSLKAAYPEARIVCIRKRAEMDNLTGLLSVEVNAVLMAEIGGDVLIKSLDLVMSGETVIPHHFLRSSIRPPIVDDAGGQTSELTEATATPLDPSRSNLSVQEREILQLLVRGHTNRAIGLELSLSDATVKVYVKEYFERSKCKIELKLQFGRLITFLSTRNTFPPEIAMNIL